MSLSRFHIVDMPRCSGDKATGRLPCKGVLLISAIIIAFYPLPEVRAVS